MKQICYLHTEMHTKKLDDLFSSVDALATKYEIEDIPSLVAFIQREKTLHTQDYLILDLTNMTYSVAHVLSAVQYLRRFARAELIVFASNGADEKELFASLASTFHVRHLITLTPETQLELEVKKCILGENSPLKFVQNIVEQAVGVTQATVETVNIPEGVIVSIGVAGAINRCGTSTQSFALYHLLKKMGFRVAILDRDGTLAEVMSACFEHSFNEELEYSTIMGFHFCHEESPYFNAYIEDFEVLTERNAPDFAQQDISILVFPTKAWELLSVMPKIQLAQKSIPQELLLFASFTPQEDADELTESVGKIWCTPYYPNIFEPEIDKIYSDCMAPLIRQVCDQKS